eukprot:PhF_6_TR31503/c3_g1_i4/m.46382/K17914/KIF13; kinesin family member 13
MSPFQPGGVTLESGNGKRSLLDNGDDDDDDEDEEDKAEVAQEQCYALAGAPILQASWQGYNGCVFAYGQTNSGKTYTMMGTKRDPGLIPRLCRQLFERLEDQTEAEQTSGKKKTTSVQVTYMEIYNEQVRDLLKPRPKQAQQRFNSRFDQHAIDEYQSLKVRQHPLHGPFVEGITKVEVRSWLECVQIIRAGNELRTQTNTNMNENSSRSHAIFQVVVTHTEAMGAKVRGKEVTNHRVSKVNLVDLAGSERIVKSGVQGKHVTEATHINQSLSTLRKVIDTLITNYKIKTQTNGVKKSQQPLVIPYRESLLTWILADNFGGNSKTVMIATVSPASSSWHETESTLRYATLARGVVNRVRVNEDPSTKLIRELQAQLKALQEEMVQVRVGTMSAVPDEARQAAQVERVKDLEEQIEMNNKAIDELHSREDTLRSEMLEYKSREQALLKQQEELRKGEAYWRNKAMQLTEESEKLRLELEKAKLSTTNNNTDSNNQNMNMIGPDGTVVQLGDKAASSLRLTREDKKMFWLDDTPVEEASKHTELLKNRKKRLAQQQQAPPSVVVPAPAPAPVVPELALHKVMNAPLPPPPPPIEWSGSSPDAKVKQNGGKDKDKEAFRNSIDKRRQTQPLLSGTEDMINKFHEQPRPISDGPQLHERKHGRRANTGDSIATGALVAPTASTADSAQPKQGRRAHSHLTGDVSTNVVSSVVNPLTPPLGVIPVPMMISPNTKPALTTSSAIANKSSQQKTSVVGTDALDEFLKQPITSKPTGK